ncbi:MAG: hypothetical protein WD081_04100 [Gammaproteobacteria bacterium]
MAEFLEIIRSIGLDYNELIRITQKTNGLGRLGTLLRRKAAVEIVDFSARTEWPLVDYVEGHFINSNDYYWAKSSNYNPNGRPATESDIAFAAGNKLAEELQSVLGDIADGLPIYTLKKGGVFGPAEDSETGRWVLKYVSQMPWIEHVYECPDWCQEIYIRPDEHKVFQWFSCDPGRTEAKAALKEAFQWYLSKLRGHDQSTLSQSSGSMGTRERNSFLLIFAALCTELNLDYNTPEKTGVIISSMLDKIGLTLNSKTIASKLRDIPTAIEARGS